MKKVFALFTITTLVVVAYSCKKTNDTPGTATIYLDLPATPYVYNAQSGDSAINQKATLGRVLFYDSRMSINNALSCASCHKQTSGFADNVAFSVGYNGMLTKRNSKNIANIEGDGNVVVFGGPVTTDPNSQAGLPLFWDGRVSVLTDLVARPITNHIEMGFVNFDAMPQKLSGVSYYGQLFASAYKGDSTITTDRISECVADFLASIQSHNSKMDKFISNGTSNASNIFSNQEMAGYLLFTSKYNCDNCHHVFSTSYGFADFKDIGLDATYTDMGRGAITKEATDNGLFKVPSLHNVALTAPYMHDGRYKTLSDVIDHYSHNIQSSANLDEQLKDAITGMPAQMNISDNDKQALIAFLNTFTDYDLVTDPKFSNPFKSK